MAFCNEKGIYDVDYNWIFYRWFKDINEKWFSSKVTQKKRFQSFNEVLSRKRIYILPLLTDRLRYLDHIKYSYTTTIKYAECYLIDSTMIKSNKNTKQLSTCFYWWFTEITQNIPIHSITSKLARKLQVKKKSKDLKTFDINQ